MGNGRCKSNNCEKISPDMCYNHCSDNQRCVLKNYTYCQGRLTRDPTCVIINAPFFICLLLAITLCLPIFFFIHAAVIASRAALLLSIYVNLCQQRSAASEC